MDGTSRSKGMHRLGAVLIACFVGAPLAAAPLATGQVSFRPLTISHKAIQVAKAFGPDDEDCIYVTRHVPRPDGNLHSSRKLICQD
jgi:hypothetical protein